MTCSRDYTAGFGANTSTTAKRTDTPEQQQLLTEICQGMLCPSLARLRDYVDWLKETGFQDLQAQDISRQVEPTWEHCIRIVGRPWVRLLSPFMGQRIRRFVSAVPTMHRAFAIEALGYGMITARKPE